MQWLVDIFEGKPSSEAAQHLQQGFVAWARSSGHVHDASTGRRRPSFPALAQCLGLPANPDQAMLKLRDWHLQRASELLGVDYAQRWQRAVTLNDAAQRFMARQWPCWWALQTPPDHASGLDRELWHAARAGMGRLPQTARRYAQILKAMETS